MAGNGRFGKYGDLKRKELIRSARVFRHRAGKAQFTSAKAAPQGRPEKYPNK